MEKTDKELAVELACAYISAWFSASGGNNPIKKPMSGDELDALLQNCYSSVSSLGKQLEKMLGLSIKLYI